MTAAEIAARAGITNPTPSMPIDAAGTVVAPVLPKVADDVNSAGAAEAGSSSSPAIGPARGTVGGAVSDPSVMTLPGLNGPNMGAAGGSGVAGPTVVTEAKEMATAEPTRASAPAVGVKMQPPAPSQEPTVDYGQMMEQALADPTGAPVVKPVLPPLVGGDGAAGGAASASTSAGTGDGSAGAFGMTMTDVNNGAAGGSTGSSAGGATTSLAGNPAAAGAPAELPGEPVANPFSMTLPPPPAPTVGPDMMPPAMPGASAGALAGVK